MNYVYVAVGVVVLMLAGACYFLWNENGQLREDIATERSNVVKLKGAVQEQKNQVEKLKGLRELDQERMDLISEKQLEAEEKYERTVQEYENYRGRMDNVARQRPELFAKIRKKHIDKLMKEIYDVTNPQTFVQPAPAE